MTDAPLPSYDSPAGTIRIVRTQQSTSSVSVRHTANRAAGTYRECLRPGRLVMSHNRYQGCMRISNSPSNVPVTLYLASLVKSNVMV